MNIKSVIDLHTRIDMNTRPIASFLAGIIMWGVATSAIKTSAIGVALYLTGLVAMLMWTVVSMNHIFQKSMYGEDAYRYMSLPVSFRTLATGKLCAAATQCTAAFLVAFLCLDYFMIRTFGSGASDSYDAIQATVIALINLHSQILGGTMTTACVIFIIAVAPTVDVIESFFLCAVVQLGVIIRNLMDPQQQKPQVAVFMTVLMIILYGTVTVIFLWLPGLIFVGSIAIPQLLIAMALKAAGTLALLQSSVRLLEKKYALS